MKIENKRNKQNKKLKSKKAENKKAQMKIQEMAFVLVAVVFLGGILLLFFARFQMTSIQKTATELRELRTITMLRVIASMPELSCKEEALCIDQDKLNVFNANINNIQAKYEQLWQSSSITKIIVEEVYPKTTTPRKYKIYEKTTTQNTVTYSTFIPLCVETLKPQCKIAKIHVTTIVP